MFQQNFIMDTKIGISYVMGHEIFFIFFSNHSQLSGHTNTGRAKFNPWIIICQILIQSTRILRWICPQSWNLYVSAYLKKQDRKKKKMGQKDFFSPRRKGVEPSEPRFFYNSNLCIQLLHRKRIGCGARPIQVQILALSLTSLVILDDTLNLSVPQFVHL